MKLHINEHLLKGILGFSLAGSIAFSFTGCNVSENPNYKNHFFGSSVDLCGDFDVNYIDDAIIYYYYDNDELKLAILKTKYENDLYNVIDFTTNKTLLSLDDEDCVKIKQVNDKYGFVGRQSMHFIVSLIYEKEIVDSEPFVRYLEERYGNKSIYSSLEVQDTIDYVNNNIDENYKVLSKRYYSFRNEFKQE